MPRRGWILVRGQRELDFQATYAASVLVVHGVLHVLGHDHAEPPERIAMQARERQLL
ncbi:MAG: rRNA maturation RNAse YbeY, partial [Ilumatobacteraceae bacterium]